jgi:hypothetical protein
MNMFESNSNFVRKQFRAFCQPSAPADYGTFFINLLGRILQNMVPLWNISERHIQMKCLSIFKGHEHVLGNKIAKFGARALQRRIYSSICLYDMQST